MKQDHSCEEIAAGSLAVGSSDERVCAIIVTYHPGAAMVSNVARVLEQVDWLVVVDNGSGLNELQGLRDLQQQLSFELLENGSNLGIAEALNRGVLAARARGFSWVILFDQDSELTPGFVKDMFRTLKAQPCWRSIASFHPRYINPETGTESAISRAADGGPMTSMTSGALMPIWIFDAIGLFAAEYFIDLVDCEYCLRIRAAGYLVGDSREAVLWHKAGTPDQRSVLGFRFGPTHHSPMRRYYMSRNRVVVYRTYFFRFPTWTLHSAYLSIRETMKCFLAERQRRRKLRNFLLGTWDGFRGTMGKREGI